MKLRETLARPLALVVAVADALGDMRRVGVSTFRDSYRAMVEVNRR